MSFYPAETALCETCDSNVELKIVSREADLGDFSVRRALPVRERRSLGPFVFFDHMGPADFPPGKGISVRPHPHIGIATLTYLFEGEIMHRDSLGIRQPITPGAVNLMVAGRGIVHSERAGSDLHQQSRLHGIQSWIALPEDQQEIDPSFEHFSKDALPKWQEQNCRFTLILGEFKGYRSPVPIFSETLYVDIQLSETASFTLPDCADERAIYLVEGECAIDNEQMSPGVMAIIKPGSTPVVRAKQPSRVMLLGGASMGARYIEWNFVSTSKERIAQAKEDWEAGHFDKIEGDDEFIPLPS